MGTIVTSIADQLAQLLDTQDADPKHWPAEARAGAELMRRVNAIEESMRQQRGHWDWAELSTAGKDEYDGLWAELSRLEMRFAPDQALTLEEMCREEGWDIPGKNSTG